MNLRSRVTNLHRAAARVAAALNRLPMVWWCRRYCGGAPAPGGGAAGEAAVSEQRRTRHQSGVERADLREFRFRPRSGDRVRVNSFAKPDGMRVFGIEATAVRTALPLRRSGPAFGKGPDVDPIGRIGRIRSRPRAKLFLGEAELRLSGEMLPSAVWWALAVEFDAFMYSASPGRLLLEDIEVAQAQRRTAIVGRGGSGLAIIALGLGELGILHREVAGG